MLRLWLSTLQARHMVSSQVSLRSQAERLEALQEDSVFPGPLSSYAIPDCMYHLETLSYPLCVGRRGGDLASLRIDPVTFAVVEA